MDDFKKILNEKANEINEWIDTTDITRDSHNDPLLKAMEYSLRAGGKRLRPMICMESFKLMGGKDEEQVKPLMLSLEMIHTYSLIHDDLPAMDDDDYRRGRLSNHKVFGEDMAILAGDGLLNLAMENLFEFCMKATGKEQERRVRASYCLAKKAGIYGMIGGQSIDVLSDKDNSKEDGGVLGYIYKNKTGALLEASFMTGAILAGASDKEIEEMERTGYYVGMAFQIQDDLLDVFGDQETIGKPLNSDEENGKKTYVSLFGAEVSKECVRDYTDRALECIENIKTTEDKTFLTELIKYLVDRDK